jgi:hypothetical protein
VAVPAACARARLRTDPLRGTSPSFGRVHRTMAVDRSAGHASADAPLDSMIMDARINVSIDAWDDPAFRSAVEDAYHSVVSEGLDIDTPEAAQRAQHLLVESGYPHARVDLERSVDEVLSDRCRWLVHRVAPADARA